MASLLSSMFGHTVTATSPHAMAFLSAGAAAVIVGAGALVICGYRLEDRAASEERRWVSWHAALRVVAASLSLGAAAIHFAVVGVLALSDPLEGTLFAIAGVLQLAFGTAVIASRWRGFLRGLTAVSAGAVLAWAWSRTLGLPYGPEAWVPESIGIVDGVATSFELLAAVIGTGLLLSRDGVRLTRLSAAVAYVGTAVLVVAVATTIALVAFPLAAPATPPAASVYVR